MDDDTRALKEAFVEAYPRYVARILTERGIEMSELVADAVVDGVAALDRQLGKLVDTPLNEQRHSPLELFRESLRPVERALSAAGVPSPAIDHAHRSLHPWDTYALCPGSSKPLGATAHDAHLRWGIGKALAAGGFSQTSAPDRPAVGLLCREGDREQLNDSLRYAGYVPVDDVDDGLVLVLVDLDHTDPSVMAEVLGFGVRVVAYGDEITDMSTMGLNAAGVWKVVPRSTVLTNLNTVIPVIA